jgi:hypothetical protein
MDLLGDVGHEESCFSPFGDSVVSIQDRCMLCDKCTVGSKFILHAPDDTPR